MAISNYSELVTAVSEWAHRSDVAALIDTFLPLAESDLQIRLKLLEFEASNTISLTSGAGSLPSGWMGVRSVRSTANPSIPLRYTTPDKFAQLPDESGEAVFYTVETDQIKVWRQADTVQVLYQARFAPLTSGDPVNALITNYPDLYLFGVLTQVAMWEHDDEAMKRWGLLLEAAVARVRKNDRDRKYAGVAMQVRAS
jgi:hypothetical protein